MSTCEELSGFRRVWSACFVASEKESLVGCGLSPSKYLGHHVPCGWTRAREDSGLWRVLGALFKVSESWRPQEPQTGQTQKLSMELVGGGGGGWGY